MDQRVLAAEFQPEVTYCNTASQGLLPTRTAAALTTATSDMAAGRIDHAAYYAAADARAGRLRADRRDDDPGPRRGRQRGLHPHRTGRRLAPLRCGSARSGGRLQLRRQPVHGAGRCDAAHRAPGGTARGGGRLHHAGGPQRGAVGGRPGRRPAGRPGRRPRTRCPGVAGRHAGRGLVPRRGGRLRLRRVQRLQVAAVPAGRVVPGRLRAGAAGRSAAAAARGLGGGRLAVGRLLRPDRPAGPGRPGVHGVDRLSAVPRRGALARSPSSRNWAARR